MGRDPTNEEVPAKPEQVKPFTPNSVFNDGSKHSSHYWRN